MVCERTDELSLMYHACESPLRRSAAHMGFLRHMLLGGVVPTRVSQPRSVVLNASCDDSFRSQRSMLGPTKSSGILLKVASVSGAPRGASL